MYDGYYYILAYIRTTILKADRLKKKEISNIFTNTLSSNNVKHFYCLKMLAHK